METKFTKGPWMVSLCGENNRVNASVTGADGSPVASCGGAALGYGIYSAESRERSNANARLIAAAPELYEACEMQQRLIDDMARLVGQMTLQDYALFNEAPIKARAALAKARGD